ncbi:DUF983 domain-containing protein [Litorimonas haliclonae]|uniref:DUF983 domain-containing protein n=1 Tax=Litorimonas haliclonae TaxID=2081977 RepID=UPI0039EF6735
MSHSKFKDNFPNTLWSALSRGALLKCPRCSQGRLFQSYLKPVHNCSNCDKKWDTVRADLAPAWASMTLSAHVIVVVYHFFFFDAPIANWITTSALIAIAALISLLSLPSFKGLFMALVWWNRMEAQQG